VTDVPTANLEKPRATPSARWSLVALVVLAAVAAFGAFVVAPALSDEGGVTVALSDEEGSTSSSRALVRDSRHLLLDADELAALPTTGRAWEAVLETASGDLGDPDLEDQDNTNAGQTLAAALVYARTRDDAFRDRVVDQLEQLPELSLEDARVLSVARQIGGYALSADLVGYRDPELVEFLSEIRSRDLGNHGRWTSLAQTSEDTANNWGTWALASRVAVSGYLGDTEDVEEAAEVFRGFLGDRDAYSGFQPTRAFDETYVCGDPDDWVPINPADCDELSGAAVEDISRSRGPWPEVTGNGLQYSWEVLASITMTAVLLEQAGYEDVYDWSDQAILRAAQFVERQDGFPAKYSTTQYVAWSLNKAYDEDLPTEPAGFGRQFGYTDWLP
jgi:hypothetical protein